jgi:hypothetical protein
MSAMAEKKTGDPKDGAEHVGGARFIPIAAPRSQVAIVIPGPLTAGRPKPEPEDERWTLAPGVRRAKPPADAAGDEAAPTEPVHGRVRPAGEANGEPDLP